MDGRRTAVAVTCSSGTVRGSGRSNLSPWLAWLFQVSEVTGQRVCRPHTTLDCHRLAPIHFPFFSLSWSIPSSSPSSPVTRSTPTSRLPSPLSRSTTRPHSRHNLLSVHSDGLCSDSGIFVSPLFPFFWWLCYTGFGICFPLVGICTHSCASSRVPFHP